MAFYVYESWQAGSGRAVLHSADCAYCNEGRGLQGGSDRSNGKWHGPYETLASAREFPRTLRVDERTEHACVHRWDRARRPELPHSRRSKREAGPLLGLVARLWKRAPAFMTRRAFPSD